MQEPNATSYTISDFLEWEASRQLVLTPKFQRRDVWVPKAKSYLIDTILRSMPIPPLFIRLSIDASSRRALREVVDGQQRLRTVLGYVRDEFPVMKIHNGEHGGKYYSQLPEDVQKGFLGYKFLTNVLQNVTDSEILSIFARMNTYTVRLNAQELRNASFFGVFKQTVYDLAHAHYAFWRSGGILKDADISRMADAELVSVLLVSMVRGVGATKKSDLAAVYKQYDDEFPHMERTISEFSTTMDILGSLFDGSIGKSHFHRIPLFYTIFCAVYDAKFGLPNSKRPRVAFKGDQIRMISSHIRELDRTLDLSEPPAKYRTFIDSTKKSTADPGSRRLRHDFIWDQVLIPAVGKSGLVPTA